MTRKVAIEVCAYSLESCIAAEKAGADRIELCASPFEGGTTPSAGLVKLAKQRVSIPIHVMIRPRGGDFCYDEDELEIMKADIEMAKQLNCEGVVFGVLRPDGHIDVEKTKELIAIAKPMEVTIHRAFDMSVDAFESLEHLIELGCTRILTSAMQNKVADGIVLLKQLVEKASNRIQIMAGSGVNDTNALSLMTVGVDALHLSGKSTRDSEMIFRRKGISMGGFVGVPEYEIGFSDVNKIRKVVGIREDFI